MASFAVSTPSPPARVHTPGTPKHGYTDSWEPFSPRKSARISEQRLNHRTPSPRSSQRQPSHHTRTHTNTRASTSRKTSNNLSTPVTSPQKKRMPAMDSVRRVSASLTAEGTANAADSLGIAPKSQQQKSRATAANSRSAGMLPTPAKTPRKQPDAQTEAASRAIARNLFSSETDVVPTPKKKAKKYTGLTLESFRAEEMEEPIPIFTDSRDRVPEVDPSTDNPFYGDSIVPTTEAEPSKRRSKRKQVTIPGTGKQSVEEAVRRDDGIVYVFRGKKIFRKFSESVDANSTDQPEIEEEGSEIELNDGPAPKRQTRSSIKPRLLFPPQDKGKAIAGAATEDEEATTDIEDHVLNDAEDAYVEGPATPMKMADEKPDTPEAPRFAPASPPTTARATRATNKLHAEDSPMKRPTKPRSPFDGWRRSKSRAVPHGQKREGETLAAPSAASKRQRT